MCEGALALTQAATYAVAANLQTFASASPASAGWLQNHICAYPNWAKAHTQSLKPARNQQQLSRHPKQPRHTSSICLLAAKPPEASTSASTSITAGRAGSSMCGVLPLLAAAACCGCCAAMYMMDRRPLPASFISKTCQGRSAVRHSIVSRCEDCYSLRPWQPQSTSSLPEPGARWTSKQLHDAQTRSRCCLQSASWRVYLGVCQHLYIGCLLHLCGHCFDQRKTNIGSCAFHTSACMQVCIHESKLATCHAGCARSQKKKVSECWVQVPMERGRDDIQPTAPNISWQSAQALRKGHALPTTALVTAAYLCCALR